MRYIRPVWQNKIELDKKLGIILILLFTISRFAVVLSANTIGNYLYVSLLFIAMILTPFILLTDKGKVAIGYHRPKSHLWVFYSFLIGIVACSAVYFIGYLFFRDTISNWFVYISHSYQNNLAGLNDNNKLQYFLMFAAVSITFSPFGEELLYRGVIHRCFSYDYDDNEASIVDSLSFALVHLAHFGIIYVAGAWDFLFIPSLIWVFLMYLTGRLFYIFREKSGSIFGSIAGHAGFNLAMMFYIFYFIL